MEEPEDSEKQKTVFAGMLFLLFLLPLMLYVYNLLPFVGMLGAFLLNYVFGTIHEMGHIIPIVFFTLLGATSSPGARFIITLGGSFAQVFVPAMVSLYYLFIDKSKPMFFVFLAFTLFSLWSVGVYMSTAENPTGFGITPNGEWINVSLHPESHDWRNIFLFLGVLDQGDAIANFTESFGAAYGLAAFFSVFVALLEIYLAISKSQPTLFFFGSVLASLFLVSMYNYYQLLFLVPAIILLGIILAVRPVFKVITHRS